MISIYPYHTFDIRGDSQVLGIEGGGDGGGRPGAEALHELSLVRGLKAPVPSVFALCANFGAWQAGEMVPEPSVFALCANFGMW